MIRLVSVKWDDAWGDKDDEVTLENVKDTHKATKVTTIGWLVYEDENGVSVFNETYEGKYRGRTFIPRAMVVEIADVLPPKKTRKPRASKNSSHPPSEDSSERQ